METYRAVHSGAGELELAYNLNVPVRYQLFNLQDGWWVAFDVQAFGGKLIGPFESDGAALVAMKHRACGMTANVSNWRD